MEWISIRTEKPPCMLKVLLRLETRSGDVQVDMGQFICGSLAQYRIRGKDFTSKPEFRVSHWCKLPPSPTGYEEAPDYFEDK